MHPQISKFVEPMFLLEPKILGTEFTATSIEFARRGRGGTEARKKSRDVRSSKISCEVPYKFLFGIDE